MARGLRRRDAEPRAHDRRHRVHPVCRALDQRVGAVGARWHRAPARRPQALAPASTFRSESAPARSHSALVGRKPCGVGNGVEGATTSGFSPRVSARYARRNSTFPSRSSISRPARARPHVRVPGAPATRGLVRPIAAGPACAFVRLIVAVRLCGAPRARARRTMAVLTCDVPVRRTYAMRMTSATNAPP